MGWFTAQIGAREHYLAARSLNRIAQLRRLYTDIWCDPSSRWAQWLPGASSDLANRSHSEIPADRVVSWNLRFIADRVRSRLGRPASKAETYHGFLRTGEKFGRCVSSALASERID